LFVFEVDRCDGIQKIYKFVEAAKPDGRFNSVIAAKFINGLMYEGKKSTAEPHLLRRMDIVAKRNKETPPFEVFETAINRCKPNVEVRSKRVGGSNYQVPMPVNRRRQQSLAFRWIRDAARAKKGKPMADALAAEILDAFKGEGTAVTTRENVHRMADANKAFAHFAW
jgi:small subunit ribosomal protein S7